MPKKESKEDVLNDLRLLVKRANQRILRIERRYGKDKWAIKNLKARLDIPLLNAWTETNRVRANKSMSLEQLKAIRKATNTFLKSKTSQVREIKKIIKEQQKRDKESWDFEPDEEEEEMLYNIRSDRDFNILTGVVTQSVLYDYIVNYAVPEKPSLDTFIEDIEEIGNFIADEDLRNSMINLYNKYVLRKKRSK